MKKSVIIILLLAIILSTSLSGCCILGENPTYTASGTMYVHCAPTQDTELSITEIDFTDSKILISSCINVGESNIFRGIIEEQFPDEEYTYTFESINNTEVIKISVTSENPETSAKICNEMLTVFPSVIYDIIEGTTCKIVDFATAPSKPDKIRFFR